MDYLPLLVFVLLAMVIIAAEAMWLAGRGWTTSGRAWTFVISTDLIGFGIGGVVSFAIVGVMLMMTFGPDGRGGTSSDVSYVALSALALLLPPLVLLFVKQIFIMLFKMPGGGRAWAFSLVASFLAGAVVAIPPPVVYYLLSKDA
jgi:hypothetical protein